MKLLLLLLCAVSASAQSPARRKIKVTTYATPLESDFGDKAVEATDWRIDGEDKVRRSMFAKGFTSRKADDPKHPDIMGVGMEGCGWISPEFHKDDATLMEALSKGYRVLTLERWDAKKKKAYFILTRNPVGGDDGEPLVEGVSAAVRAGNKTFPTGRWVKLYKDAKAAGYRRIHDECSSCESDYHLDLYRRLDDSVAAGGWEAELMPKGFKPPK